MPYPWYQAPADGTVVDPPDSCRLFVGNVPFTSLWSALKAFLVLRAAELEPLRPVDVLRVELPMQRAAGNGAAPLLRGFAIVTTGNAETSELLILLLDRAEFEGRPLTVRYDRFPAYGSGGPADRFASGDLVLARLAYERSQYHQNVYRMVPSEEAPGEETQGGTE